MEDLTLQNFSSMLSALSALSDRHPLFCGFNKTPFIVPSVGKQKKRKVTVFSFHYHLSSTWWMNQCLWFKNSLNFINVQFLSFENVYLGKGFSWSEEFKGRQIKYQVKKVFLKKIQLSITSNRSGLVYIYIYKFDLYDIFPYQMEIVTSSQPSLRNRGELWVFEHRSSSVSSEISMKFQNNF